jgi:hypothetical protein
MDITQFRSNFPEFADTTAYPNTQITFWATVAEKMVIENVWLDMYETGVSLYVAHELVLARQNVLTAATGGLPGQGGGIASSKTVGSVNVSYDPNTTTEKNAGFWNLTNYGKQFYRFTQIFGAGCIQL